MTELGTFLMPVIPLLGLLAMLLLGRYPGCEAIVRLAERIAGRGLRARPAPRRPAPRSPRTFAPAGGLLIALGLARRPPPAAA